MKTHGVLWCLCLIAPVIRAADPSDFSFYHSAAYANIAEVQQGEMAQTAAYASAVKQFAAMMVKDHSAAEEQLRALAAKKQLELPVMASAEQIAARAKLQTLAGEAFDKAYISQAIQNHQDAIVLFEQESRGGTDSDFKAYAQSALPTLQAHLDQAKALAAKMGHR